MTTSVTTLPTGEVARPLGVLVPLIRAELQAGDNAGIEHYRKAGELLIEARRGIRHGEWVLWVQRNFKDASGLPLSRASATRYMKLAILSGATGDGRARPFATLSEATDRGRSPGHRPAWDAGVKQVVNRVDVSVLAQEAKNRAQEHALQRELAIKLIDIGYKVLSTKLHPDKGGSAEAMSRLNAVRKLLKEAVQ